MNDNLVVATTSPSICDNNYGFVIIVKPTKNIVALSLQNICELKRNSTKLTLFSCKTLYAAVDKKINGLDITPAFHNLSNLSRFIIDDNQL